jgi:hypothetical protein
VSWSKALCALALLCPFDIALSQALDTQMRKIDLAQWQEALKKATAAPGAAVQESPEQLLILVNGDSAQDIYFFSKPELPAHPAMVRMRLGLDAQGRPSRQVSGAYAGSKEAFDLWLKGVLARVSQGGGR